jgi:anaerobic carbon-monoxide dehydrogenase iron sulfur subunit
MRRPFYANPCEGGPHFRKGELAVTKILTVNPDKCVYCRTCELVCSLENDGECNPKKARIRIVGFDEQGFWTPTICFQCREAYCVRACPSAAIKRNEETGALVIDEDRCVGCRMCTMVCPFGQISLAKNLGRAVKCELCGGDPMCVKFCPTGALQFEVLDSFQAEKRRTVARKVMLASQSDLPDSKK